MDCTNFIELLLSGQAVPPHAVKQYAFNRDTTKNNLRMPGSTLLMYAVFANNHAVIQQLMTIYQDHREKNVGGQDDYEVLRNQEELAVVDYAVMGRFRPDLVNKFCAQTSQLTIAALLANKKYNRNIESADIVLGLLRHLPQMEYL